MMADGNRVSTAYERSAAIAYGETFRCPAGVLCLDFCNTGQGVRGKRQTEWIPGFGDLIDWLELAGALEAPHAAQLREAGNRSAESAVQAWAGAIRFRESLFRVLDARAVGAIAADQDLAAIEENYARALPFAHLAWTDTRYAWIFDKTTSALESVIQPLAESAVALLTSDRLARLRRCGNPTCYWLFIDDTRNHSRRWCEMASCGNVHKVRRHRERARSASHTR